jgi:rubrerythrin
VSIAFTGKELIDVATNIERSGMAFYDVMTRSAGSAEARKVFRYLFDMEKQHEKIFRDTLTGADIEKAVGEDEEYRAYFRSLVDNAVFTSEMAAGELATNANSDTAALELGIAAEKDSILFYYGMRDTVSPSSEPIVDKIIAEERSHLTDLTRLKRKLTAKPTDNPI